MREIIELPVGTDPKHLEETFWDLLIELKKLNGEAQKPDSQPEDRQRLSGKKFSQGGGIDPRDFSFAKINSCLHYIVENETIDDEVKKAMDGQLAEEIARAGRSEQLGNYLHIAALRNHVSRYLERKNTQENDARCQRGLGHLSVQQTGPSHDTITQLPTEFNLKSHLDSAERLIKGIAYLEQRRQNLNLSDEKSATERSCALESLNEQLGELKEFVGGNKNTEIRITTALTKALAETLIELTKLNKDKAPKPSSVFHRSNRAEEGATYGKNRAQIIGSLIGLPEGSEEKFSHLAEFLNTIDGALGDHEGWMFHPCMRETRKCLESINEKVTRFHM